MKLWEGMSERARVFINLAVIVLGVYLGFRFILPLVLPFIVAYILTWIVRPVTEFLSNKVKMPRIVAGSASLVLFFVIIFTVIFYLGNILIKQFVNFVRNIPVYLNILAGKLDNICSSCDELFGLAAGSVRAVVDEHMLKIVDKVKADVIPGITARTFHFIVKAVGFIGILVIIFISAALIIKDLPDFKSKYKNTDLFRDFTEVTSRLGDMGVAYFRSQMLIMVLIALCIVTGLMLIGNDYALLLGLSIAFMDALPVLGTGLILVPWSIISLINGNIYAAAILITIYLACQIIREVLEPKLIGNKIGIKPLYTLISMYIGLRLFGVAGFILGPVGLIIIITVIKLLNEKAPVSYTLDKGAKLE